TVTLVSKSAHGQRTITLVSKSAHGHITVTLVSKSARRLMAETFRSLTVTWTQIDSSGLKC
ncbi:MAG: hypothetical protein LBS44_06580, partial [Deltaproteobacteria bacterium]|nr:hypothetical protein [Deltaproteobacteria bacterium]